MPKLYWDASGHCLRDSSGDASRDAEVSGILGDRPHMIKIRVSGKRKECSRFLSDLTAFPYYRVERVSDYVDRTKSVYITAQEVRYRGRLFLVAGKGPAICGASPRGTDAGLSGDKPFRVILGPSGGRVFNLDWRMMIT